MSLEKQVRDYFEHGSSPYWIYTIKGDFAAFDYFPSVSIVKALYFLTDDRNNFDPILYFFDKQKVIKLL